MDVIDADAWILCAATGDRPATLRELISAADYLNCAIPTLDELNGAMVRLTAAGLVEVSDRCVSPSTAVRALWAAHSTLPARRVPAKFAEFLRSWPSYSPTAPIEGAVFTAEDVKAAYESYRTAVRTFT
jgi:hypothetical protein